MLINDVSWWVFLAGSGAPRVIFVGGCLEESDANILVRRSNGIRLSRERCLGDLGRGIS